MVRGAKPEHRLVSIFSSAESSSDHTVFDRGIPFRTHCCFFLIRNARGMAKIYKHPTKRNYHTSTTTKPNDITIRERGERSGSSSNSVQTVSVFRRRRSPTFEGSNRAGGTRRPMGCCEGDGVFGSTPLPIRKGKGGGGVVSSGPGIEGGFGGTCGYRCRLPFLYHFPPCVGTRR